MKNAISKILLTTALAIPAFIAHANQEEKNTQNYTIFKLNSITPENKQMEVTDDKLYIGVNGAPCTLIHNEAISNIDPGANNITFYTLKNFQAAFSLNGEITCLKFTTTHQGKSYSTGDIKLTLKNKLIQATPQELTWNFNDKNQEW